MANGTRLFSTSSGQIQGSVWRNAKKGPEGGYYNSFQIQKLVWDRDGNPKYYSSFFNDDLEAVEKVIKNLKKFLTNPTTPEPVQADDPFELEKTNERLDEIDKERAG